MTFSSFRANCCPLLIIHSSLPKYVFIFSLRVVFLKSVPRLLRSKTKKQKQLNWYFFFPKNVFEEKY